MKIAKTLALIFTAFIIITFASYAYFGGLTKVDVAVLPQGGELIVYESHTGDYAKTKEIMDRIYYDLRDSFKIETTKGIGVYYDDPKKVEKSKLRFEAGEVLENVTQEQIESLKKKYKVRTIPKGDYIVAEFPFKGIPSVIVGIMKVYPAFAAYLEERGLNPPHPSLEIYDMPAKKTTYKIMVSE